MGSSDHSAVRRTRRGRLWAAVLSACLALGGAGEALAAQGFSTSLPVAGKKPVAGLTLTFDCVWPDGAAYVPMRLTFQCLPPAPVDRTLAVEITTRTFGEPRPITVRAQVEIPAGAKSVTKVVPFPRCSFNYNLSLNVWEQGSFYEDLSFENRGMFSAGLNAAPATLFVSTKQVDISGFNFITAAYNNYNPYSAPPVAGHGGHQLGGAGRRVRVDAGLGAVRGLDQLQRDRSDLYFADGC